MRNILILGAGKSTAYLVDYLLSVAVFEELQITIGDLHPSRISKSAKEHPNCQVIYFDVNDDVLRQKEISRATLVISMLPSFMHIKIAEDCLQLKKHLVTASYVNREMQKFHEPAVKAGLVFLNEVGLDPGIDHMSAMEVIDRIKEAGGKMILFESFTGGLIAPSETTNLWNYKFTWNPRNVVLAGQGGAAKFIQEGTYKYIPQHKLFRRTEFLKIEGYGKFEAYANRDSLHYREIYGLEDILTLYRGTIRRVGFSKAWNIFVQLGMTDDSYHIENSQGMSYRDFVNLFLPYSPTDSVELKLRHYLKIDQDDIMWEKLLELNIFSSTRYITKENATPAKALQEILEQSWTLAENEKDMIVMYHKFGYELEGQKKQIDANMVVLGESKTHTAMAKTVGLPVAMAAINILNKKITTAGVQLPIKKEFYAPILEGLKTHGITFNEIEMPYLGYNPDSVAG